jgi:hypothetical protein
VFGSTSIVLLYAYTAEVATKRELLIVPERKKREALKTSRALDFAVRLAKVAGWEES